jgi:hypothetical protein
MALFGAGDITGMVSLEMELMGLVQIRTPQFR